MADLQLLEYLEGFLTEGRKARFLDVLSRRTNHFTVAMEDVFQLHNTSAVMRSCEVFGLQQLNVIEERFSKTIDKEIAMGAEKWVDINRFSSIAECMLHLRQAGYRIVATTPHTSDFDLDSFDIATPAAFFFGTERNGLSQEILDHADAFLKIPMHGFTESLNISVSAAIILQHMSSRLRNSAISWQLSEEELLEKRLDWARKSIKDIERVEARYYQASPSAK
ncbi:MAG: TrmH family RNA methyltransferase [Sphingobacteriales bacterium]|nr:MAG: TrmH family RNA methyltransferase [Sphingobacteriales bacterium]